MVATYCGGCGAVQIAGSTFCASCGRRIGGDQQTAPYWGPPVVARGTNGYAIASLVCSLVSCGIGSILGVVFGKRAEREIAVTGEQGDGLARAGIIIGWIGIAGACVVILIYIVAVFIAVVTSSAT